jgi:TatD DNase family protein
MGLADVHAHLTHPRLAAKQEDVLHRARAAGITSIVANGLNPRDNEAVRRLAEGNTMVKPAFGFYPVDTVLPEMRALGVEYPREGDECTADEGVRWVRENAADAFAVGEIGLDGYWVPESLWGRQEAAFCELVQIALDAGKPIIMHTRKRERRAFDILREMRAERVNWHCFGGKVKLARQIAEHGHFLSIPANARRSESFTRMLETLPQERILLETDCPYLAAEPGGASEPASVAGTATYVAELWSQPFDHVVERLTSNFTALFGTPP